MNLDDVYQLKMTITLGSGQDAVSNWYWVCTGGDPDSSAQDINDYWVATVVPELDDLLTTEKEVDSLQVINGMDNADFFESTPSVDGVRAGTPLSTAVGLGIRSDRDGPGFEYSHRNMPFASTGDLAASTGRFAVALNDVVKDFTDLIDNVVVVLGGGEITPCQITGGFILGTDPVVKQELTGFWSMNQWPTFQRTRQEYDWSSLT